MPQGNLRNKPQMLSDLQFAAPQGNPFPLQDRLGRRRRRREAQPLPVPPDNMPVPSPIQGVDERMLSSIGGY